jgi:osmoprotectant transport system permease protein
LCSRPRRWCAPTCWTRIRPSPRCSLRCFPGWTWRRCATSTRRSRWTAPRRTRWREPGCSTKTCRAEAAILEKSDPVLLSLLALGTAGFLALPWLEQAPNRLVSGTPVPLGAAAVWLLPPALLLAAGALRPATRAGRLAAAAGAWLLILALGWLAGAAAARLAAGAPPATRISLGPGLWVGWIAAGLAWSQATRRLIPAPSRAAAALRTGAGLLGVLPLLALALAGRLAQLSLLREYATRRSEVGADLKQHLWLIGLTLAFALPTGLALGLLAQRRAGVRGPVFGLLNVVQTIPSIALFGLLLPPLSRIGAGIGSVPAVIALTLYALLPIARTTAEGFAAIAPDTRDAARGIGMRPAQILWRVDVPLAFPTLLAGLRITIVQTIGLAVIAALIGAGGLGALVFAGLSADALDLLLLGVIPTVALALVADAGLRLLAAAAR